MATSKKASTAAGSKSGTPSKMKAGGETQSAPPPARPVKGKKAAGGKRKSD